MPTAFTAGITHHLSFRCSEGMQIWLIQNFLQLQTVYFTQILSQVSLCVLMERTVLMSINSESLPWVMIGLNSVHAESVISAGLIFGIVF